LGLGEGPLRDVVEVAGPYEYVGHPMDGDDYSHSRKITWRTDLDGRDLWKRHPLASSWNVRWALVRLV
jgi:hypothetical protein